MFFNFYNVVLFFFHTKYKAAIIIYISCSSQAPQIPFFLNPCQLFLVNNLYSSLFLLVGLLGKIKSFFSVFRHFIYYFRMNICSQSPRKFKMNKPGICLLTNYKKIKREIKSKSQMLQFLCKLLYDIVLFNP